MFPVSKGNLFNVYVKIQTGELEKSFINVILATRLLHAEVVYRNSLRYILDKSPTNVILAEKLSQAVKVYRDL